MRHWGWFNNCFGWLDISWGGFNCCRFAFPVRDKHQLWMTQYCSMYKKQKIFHYLVFPFFGWGGGSSCSNSAWVALQPFSICPNWKHLLHWYGHLFPDSPLAFILFFLGLLAALCSDGGIISNPGLTFGHSNLSFIGVIWNFESLYWIVVMHKVLNI